MSVSDRQRTADLLHTQLPRSVARVCRRGERLQHEGWDINTLQRQADDCNRLASACRDLGADGLGDALEALHASAATLLHPPRLPDRASTAHLAALIDRLANCPLPPQLAAGAAVAENRARSHENGFPLFVRAPERHALRLCPASRRASDAGAITDAAMALPATATSDAAVATGNLAALIRTALDTHGLELTFQPIMSLRGDDDEQFQALLRLRDADGQLHAAAELVPAATHAGLIGAIDRWVLQSCVERIMQRSRSGRAPRLFLSHSIDSLRDAEAPAWLRALLARCQVAGDALVLDLRIDDAVAMAADTRRHVDAMKALGVHIALSGVRPGERSRHMLEALDANFAKLDPQCHDDDAPRDTWRALIDDLHERGVRVVAPRVEDARSVSILCSLGADFIQGNFVQPVDAELVFPFHETAL